jgi:hypothetical protein
MEVGYGSYAIIVGQRKRVTHVEFGGRMSTTEALYDTLIMALNNLLRQGSVSNTKVSVCCPMGDFVTALGKNRAPQGLTARHKRVRELLAQFHSYDLSTISLNEAQRHIAG